MYLACDDASCIRGTGHFVHLEMPDRASIEIGRFFDDLVLRRADNGVVGA
jgi:hypothetical protein